MSIPIVFLLLLIGSACTNLSVETNSNPSLLSSLHKKISLTDVSSIRLWGEGIKEKTDGREATGEEMKKIVDWFNQATDIRENKNLAGTTPDAGIFIQLKNGSLINIIRSGSDFEIQRDINGEMVSYWAKQPDIKALLDQMGTNP